MVESLKHSPDSKVNPFVTRPGLRRQNVFCCFLPCALLMCVAFVMALIASGWNKEENTMKGSEVQYQLFLEGSCLTGVLCEFFFEVNNLDGGTSIATRVTGGF